MVVGGAAGGLRRIARSSGRPIKPNKRHQNEPSRAHTVGLFCVCRRSRFSVDKHTVGIGFLTFFLICQKIKTKLKWRLRSFEENFRGTIKAKSFQDLSGQIKATPALLWWSIANGAVCLARLCVYQINAQRLGSLSQVRSRPRLS